MCVRLYYMQVSSAKIVSIALSLDMSNIEMTKNNLSNTTRHLFCSV